MRRALLLSLLLSAGCAQPGLVRPPAEARGALRARGVRAAAESTVHHARFVPLSLEALPHFGSEPGGGERAIAAGYRLVALPGGSMMVASDRLPESPSQALAIPERLGGGFLFQLGPSLWRADSWLAPAKKILQSSGAASRVVMGLDRAYLRSATGVTEAFDPRTGDATDLGPWPASPFVVSYAAADAWRAVAITDWRGVLATFDAGATWKPLELPIEGRDATFTGDAIEISGYDEGRQPIWYEVRGEGQVARLHAPSRATAPRPGARAETAPDVAARIFGERPLAAAIEDGWPLEDGTALVARSGALARVRIADGALVEVAADAFDLPSARCHPVRVGAASIAFVCGEPAGRTVVYRYDPLSARLVEMRAWDAPRAVLAAGNGALAVRGACAEGAPARDAAPGQQTYCLYPKDESGWRDVRVRGDIGSERVVVLRDGRVAVVSPPRSGDVATARVTVLAEGKARTVALAFGALPRDVAHVLRFGMWLDGFEEREPGVLSGWVESNGTFLGVQIHTDGRARVGRFLRDAGTSVVSGQYGFGWSASGRGFETTDGGLHWNDVEVPPPLPVDRRRTGARACGPIGCTAGGWLRIGWGGEPPAATPPSPPPSRPSWRSAAPLELACDVAEVSQEERAQPARATVRIAPAPPLRFPRPGPPWRPGFPGWTGARDLPSFYALKAPQLREGELGIWIDALDAADRYGRLLPPAGRLYAWGPADAAWGRAARWSVRWVWAFGGPSDVRATPPVPAPFADIEAARAALGFASGASPLVWTLSPGDDPDHALLVGKRPGVPGDAQMLVLESERAPMPVRRADGEPLGDVEATTRAGGHWFFTTPQRPHELPATIVWRVDALLAHEIARVPRSSIEVARSSTRLARRSDDRAIALVANGPAAPPRAVEQRWVLPIDPDTGTLGEPENVGAVDFGDRALAPCTDADVGWVTDAPWTAPVRLHIGAARGSRALDVPMVRVRASVDGACIDRIGGILPEGGEALEASPRQGDAPAISVGIARGRDRLRLRCAPATTSSR